MLSIPPLFYPWHISTPGAAACGNLMLRACMYPSHVKTSAMPPPSHIFMACRKRMADYMCLHSYALAHTFQLLFRGVLAKDLQEFLCVRRSVILKYRGTRNDHVRACVENFPHIRRVHTAVHLDVCGEASLI